MMTRRRVLSGAIAAPAVVWATRAAQAAQDLKISHQFPGGSEQEGDFRDRLCRLFSREIAKRSNGAVTASVYPGSSLMKTNSQFSALRKGALDMSLFPLAYAGGEVPEVNIGLMPCIVSSYAQGAAWRRAQVGQKLASFMAEKGIVIVSWVWQSDGVVSRAGPIVSPDDVKGLKVRGGSREMDLVLQAAGAAVMSLPSNESYAAMQTGAVDAIVTSSTSMISFRLQELSKNLTLSRNNAFLFTFEPLLMSKKVFDALDPRTQDIVMTIGSEMDAFGMAESQADDDRVAEIYKNVGVQVHDIDQPAFDKWKAIARETAWKDYARRSATAAELLEFAQSLPA